MQQTETKEKKSRNKTQRDNSELVGQLSRIERQLLHSIMLFEKSNERTPKIAELQECYSGNNSASKIGEFVKRLCDKGFLVKTDKGIYSVSYKRIAVKSFTFMFDANGEAPITEYIACYGLRKITFHARNMWEASRFATAIGDPDYIQERGHTIKSA